MLRTVLSIIIISFWYSVGVAGPKGDNGADPVAVQPPTGMVPENFLLMDSSPTHPKHVLIADKETRTLTVWQAGKNVPKLIGAHPMDVGKNHGDKITMGDHKTPEGIYFFQEVKEGPSLDFNLYGKRAYTLDYPNFFDNRAGKTGNGIWLHSVPDEQSLKRGSRGCVVVRNTINDKLLPLIQLKTTPLLILDKVEYLKPEELLRRRAGLQAWIEEWRSTWETKDLERYMTFYDETFYALKMNFNNWRRYKAGLNEKYNYIKVAVKEPFLLVKREEAIISFVQDYESDGLKDLGFKTLYVRKMPDGKYKILSELWRPLDRDVIARESAVR